jgi:hypothetical protein
MHGPLVPFTYSQLQPVVHAFSWLHVRKATGLAMQWPSLIGIELWSQSVSLHVSVRVAGLSSHHAKSRITTHLAACHW